MAAAEWGLSNSRSFLTILTESQIPSTVALAASVLILRSPVAGRHLLCHTISGRHEPRSTN